MAEKYHSVNSQWPANLPPLSDQEALAGAKRLLRKAMGKKLRPGWKWKIATGNRRTWPRRGVFYVNPNRTGDLRHFQSGWPDIVHFISHWAMYALHPTWSAHCSAHLSLEKELTEYVIGQGWLEGKLKTEPKAVVPAIDRRYTNVVAGIARWSTKLKRAKTALAKLERKRKYYERKGVAA